MSYFSENYYELKYTIETETTPGLRNAQLGAIHAIASYHTLKKKNAGIIVMPTGSGKSSVIMMTPFVINAKKVLIVTPSIMVRGQIYEDYKNLDTLIKTDVFPLMCTPPKVYECQNLYSEEIVEYINNADAVVATPRCALSLSESSIKKNFDLVLIDEAHHIPAPTWQQILINMSNAEHYLFTATPFRRDKQEIKGELLFTYPLSMAFRDNIFSEIQYISIDEAPEKDKLIAIEAERVLLNDRQQKYDHYLMVRTDTKENAKKLEILYKNETSLKLYRIDSSMTFRTVKTCIKDLKDKKIDGIICVDMFGEGFDFPNLKIAAVHSPHKSLASTLQFIGRFTRTNAENISTAKFIAMNDSELKIENYELFSNDAVWQDIIIDMNEQAINKEITIKKSLQEYVCDDDTLINDESISLYSIRPNCHAKVYSVSGFNIHANFPDSCGIGTQIFRSIPENTIVGIGNIYSRPRWSSTDNVLDVENLLYIVHYQQDTSLLFIFSQAKTEKIYEDIASVFTDDFSKIPRDEMNRVLAELENFEIFNSGMQNRFIERGETYRIHAGSDVASSIDATTGMMYSAGHVFCKANSKEHGDITIGYSSGSKIWSSSFKFIPDYINWCKEFGKKIVDNTINVKTNTNFDLLPKFSRITEFPDTIFYVNFSYDTYASPPVLLNSKGDPTDIILVDGALRIDKVESNKIAFSIIFDDLCCYFTYTIDGTYHCTNPNIILKDGRSQQNILEYFNNYPLNFRTTDNCLIEGNEISSGTPDLAIFDISEIIAIDWDLLNTDIKNECDESIKEKKSIQNTVLDILSKDNKNMYLLYDHGTGEIADFITINEKDNSIETTLYHIKSMKGMSYNSNLNDIEEVITQAIKSTVWIKSRSILLEKITRRRKSNYCNLKKGIINNLEKTLKKNKIMDTKIIIVQPAINRNIEIPEKFQHILAATRFYLKNTGHVTVFEIWGSK